MVRQASFAILVAGIAVLGLGEALGDRYWTAGLGLNGGEHAPTVGQDLIDAFQCRFAETRTVQMRGLEDGFSLAGSEPSHPPAWMIDPAMPASHLTPKDFDEVRENGYVAEWFELNPGIVSGLFILSLRTLPNDRTDTLFMGDLDDTRLPLGRRTAPLFTQNLEKLAQTPGWSQRGTLVWAELNLIEMQLGSGRAHAPLLQAFQENSQATTLDVMISDDTTVDFMALVTCSRPAHHGGYTMRVSNGRDLDLQNTVLLTAEQDGRTARSGNPFVGDTDCDTALPLMCFRDDDMPAPAELDVASSRQARQSALSDKWSGGSLRATEPVRGRDFAGIDDADRFCARRFGPGWRVADHHLGGQGFTFVGHGMAPPEGTRVWIDIKDQPYATCWNRGSDAP